MACYAELSQPCTKYFKLMIIIVIHTCIKLNIDKNNDRRITRSLKVAKLNPNITAKLPRLYDIMYDVQSIEWLHEEKGYIYKSINCL